MAKHPHFRQIKNTCGRMKRAMTLVEVMVAMSIFPIGILGTFGVLNFSMKTMDDSRAQTQATQILIHEMEAMRLRSWNNTAVAGTAQLNIVTLAEKIAAQPARYAVFTPFADYGVGDVATEAQPQLSGGAALGATSVKLLNASGFTCTRNVVLNASADSAEITLVVSWKDPRGITHTRTFRSTASENGLNDSIFLVR